MLSVTGIAGRQLGAGNLGPLEEQPENGRKVVLAKAGPVLPPILSEALSRVKVYGSVCPETGCPDRHMIEPHASQCSARSEISQVP